MLTWWWSRARVFENRGGHTESNPTASGEGVSFCHVFLPSGQCTLSLENPPAGGGTLRQPHATRTAPSCAKRGAHASRSCVRSARHRPSPTARLCRVWVAPVSDSWETPACAPTCRCAGTANVADARPGLAYVAMSLLFMVAVVSMDTKL